MSASVTISLNEADADAMDALAAALAEMAANATAMGRATLLGARSGVAKLAALLRGTAALVQPEPGTRGWLSPAPDAVPAPGSSPSLGLGLGLADRACARIESSSISSISIPIPISDPRAHEAVASPRAPAPTMARDVRALPVEHETAPEEDPEVTSAIARFESEWRDRSDPGATALHGLREWLCEQHVYTRRRWHNWLQTFAGVSLAQRREVAGRLVNCRLKKLGGADNYMRRTLEDVLGNWVPPMLAAVVDNGRQGVLPYPQGAMPVIQTDWARASAQSDEDARRRKEEARQEAAMQAAKSPEQVAWEKAEHTRFLEDGSFFLKTRGNAFKNHESPRPPAPPRPWPGPGTPIPVIRTTIAEYVASHPPFTPAEEAADNAARDRRQREADRLAIAKCDAKIAADKAEWKAKKNGTAGRSMTQSQAGSAP